MTTPNRDPDLPAASAGEAPLAALPALLAGEAAVEGLVGSTGRVVAVADAARPLFVAAAVGLGHRTILVVVPTGTEAERLAHDLRAFLPARDVDVFPAWETLPFERVSPAVETMGRRLRAVWRLRRPDRAPKVLVAPVRAVVQRLGPHVEATEPVAVRPGDRLDRDELITTLVEAGYRREYQVEARGEIAVRGSIVDVYPSTADHPVRIDLWGDEVDRLSTFSVADQRSTGELPGTEIFPVRELLPTDDVRARARALVGTEAWGAEQWQRLADGQTFDGMESWLPWLADDERLLPDLLPDRSLVMLVEPRRLRDRAAELVDEERALAAALAPTWGAPDHGSFPGLSLPFDRLLSGTRAPAASVLSAPAGPSTPHLPATAFDRVVGDTEALAGRLRSLLREGSRVVIAAGGSGSAGRLTDVLEGAGVAAARRDEPSLEPGTLSVVVAPLDRGAVLPGAGLALIAEADLTGRRRVHRSPRGARRAADFQDDLTPGDYVVHHQHGVGRYAGMVSRSVAGTERDYLLLEYKGGDKLYVPTDQVGAVRRYTGGDSPALHRLGGSDFQRARAKVRTAVSEIAAELVTLYRTRLATPGHAFSADTPWQAEIADAFPYEETPDQLEAIRAVTADMERPVPMDRLICGDVGYGKTEVAVRAAFKAVQDGKQVAVLVPTTLLADQHGQTFRDRYANYPVRVEVLSRFLSPAEQAGVVAGLASGEVDVVIGTHRLLSGDIAFKDLGLLVVDEEQRFGVGHKERIKALRERVDVLTLTATPIPRTLEMSLTGIRDLSLVRTPPEDRQPILTYVGEYDERAVSEAIRREMLREGQAFFVHNRVQDIEHVADRVRALVPEARVAVAHGQMDEGTLERTVLDFADHAHDVLVCTTIVESGLDMPSVNTLVVDRADMLGLAQLYQLRGRVGRRGQRAYAYLFHPADRVLTEEAYERLKAIGEYTDLGSGFRLAMRDLEIRGAGNLLGEAQSGHVAAVGFDLYCEMVTEAVGALTGERPPRPVEVVVDVPLDAHLPRGYVGRDDVRMEAYRRLAAVTDPAAVADIRAEWLDRYGPLPPPAEALLEVAALRAECVRVGITTLSVQKGRARMSPVSLKESQKVRLRRLAPKAVLSGEGELIVPVDGPGASPGGVVGLLGGLLRDLIPADGVAPVASATL
ncbi:MAG: transcription-repair coupling factor [Acidimicrobiia bacterium]|nr:transcription-repair coupling factor [Acidimicrobiia bacterium]